MNCQQIALVLDYRDIRGLEALEQTAVQAHLRACAECARAWRAQSRLVERAIAPMPQAVPDRLWQALRAARMGRQAPGRFRRRAIGVGLVLSVAAVAAMLALTSPDSAETADETARGVPLPAPAEVEARPSAATALPPFAGTVDGQPAANRDVLAATQPGRFIVLPTEHEHRDPAAAQDVDALRAAFLTLVRDHTDTVVIELTEAQEASAPQRLSLSYAFRWLVSLGQDDSLRMDRDAAIGRYFSAGQTVRFSSDAPEGVLTPEGRWHVGVTHLRYRDGRRIGGSFTGWEESPFNDSIAARLREASERRSAFADPSAAGASVADRIRAQHARRLFLRTFPLEAGALYASLIADERLPANERLKLLGEISGCLNVTGGRIRFGVFCQAAGWSLNGRTGTVPDIFDGPVERIVAAAIELGRSGAPEIRRETWAALSQARHLAITQALTDALLYDSDASVRRAALDGLKRYLDYPVVRAAPPPNLALPPAALGGPEGYMDEAVVRAALATAAAGDASPDIRLRARWTLMTETERAAFLETALRDTNLSVEERAAIVIVDRLSRPLYPPPADRSSLELLEQAAQITSNSELELDALVFAAMDPDFSARPEFIRLIIENLDDPNVDVRRQATAHLARRRDDPVAQDALRQALARETDELLRLEIEEALTAAPPPARRSRGIRWPF